MGNRDSKPTDTKPTTNKSNENESVEPEIDPSLYEWEKDEDVPQRLDFDLWYPLISDHTPNSILIECTPKEVDAITISCDENRPSVLQSGHSKLTNEHKQTLNELASKIDKFIQDNNYTENGIFVRFSKRSPKDSILRMDQDAFKLSVTQNALSIYKTQQELEGFTGDNKDGEIINAIIRGMTIASCTGLCVKTGL